MRPAASRPGRSLRRLVAATALAVVAPLAVASGSAAAPEADPHPAAPLGGCAVTQDPTADVVSRPRTVVLQRQRSVVQERRVKRAAQGWRVILDTRVVWRGAATVDATSTYASADCGVEEQQVAVTHRRTSRVSVTLRRGAVASTRQAAVAAARKKVRRASRGAARARVVTLARESALLRGRTTFLASLPVRDEKVLPVEVANPAKRACPKRIASPTTKKGREAAQREGTVVPQFGGPATLWVCTYDAHTGVVTQRRTVTGADARHLVAGLQSLWLLPAGAPRACPSDHGRTVLVTHRATTGHMTSVAVDQFGCSEARLTSRPGKVAPGTTTSRGTPSGTFGSSELLQHALAALG